MIGKFRKILIVVVSFFSFVFFLCAQGKLTGSITGQIVDQEDNPLSGCSVTIEGPALQGQMSFITTAEGHFRFPSVPPGEGFQCTFEMSGFQTTVRKGLKVSVGKATNINITLEISTLKEEVTVIGKSPTVDVSISKTAVNYSKAYIYNIPMARDLYQVLNSMPSSISEEKSYRRTSNIAGGTVRGNQYSLDGVTFNDPVTMYPMTNINIDVYEEVEMGLFGHTADVSTADGGYINIVTKSGGDEFHGGTTIEYYNEDMQKPLITTDDLNAVGLEVPAGWNYWQDYSLYLGGPIVRDRIWFFINGRYFTWARDFNHVVWEDTLAAGTRIYTLDEAPHRETNIFGKLTFQLSPEIRLLGTYNLTMITEDFYTNALSTNYDITATKIWDGEKGHTISSQLSWVFNQNLFFDVRVAYIQRDFPILFTEYSIPDAFSLYDRYYKMNKNNLGNNQILLRKRFNPSLVATLFADDLFDTSHEFKMGAEYEFAYGDGDFWRENPWHIITYKGNIYSHRSSRYDNRGKISCRTGGNTPGSSVEKRAMRRLGLFVQDSVTIADRLTLNLGVRFDTSKGYFPTQYHAAVHDPLGLLDYLKDTDQWEEYTIPRMDALRWTHFSPRVGFSFDIFRDGKTSLKGSWSRYNEYLMLQYVALINPFADFSAVWWWFDNNYNQEYDPPPIDTYRNIYMPRYVADYDLEENLDPDTTAPYTDEFTIGVERELATDFSLTVTFVYKHKQNIFEDVNDFGLGKDEAWKGYSANSPYFERFDFLDPGDDGEFGTNDDITSSVYAVLDGAPEYHWYQMNVEGSFRKYWAINVIFNKRMSNNWQLLGSIVFSKAWGNIGGLYGESRGASVRFDDPNAWLYTPGRLDYDRPWNIKLQSTVILPYDFIISGYFRHLSGFPLGRWIGIYIPDDPKYQIPGEFLGGIRTEPWGTRRKSPETTLDLRIEKRFRIGDRMTLGGYLDIMNFAGRSGYDIESNPGGHLDYSDPDNPTFTRRGTYGVIDNAYGNRIFKVSLRFTF